MALSWSQSVLITLNTVRRCKWRGSFGAVIRQKKREFQGMIVARQSGSGRCLGAFFE